MFIRCMKVACIVEKYILVTIYEANDCYTYMYSRQTLAIFLLFVPAVIQMYSNITHLDTNLDGIWYRLLAYKFESYAVTYKQKDILLISDCETIPIENGVLFMNSLNSCQY